MGRGGHRVSSSPRDPARIYVLSRCSRWKRRFPRKQVDILSCSLRVCRECKAKALGVKKVQYSILSKTEYLSGRGSHHRRDSNPAKRWYHVLRPGHAHIKVNHVPGTFLLVLQKAYKVGGAFFLPILITKTLPNILVICNIGGQERVLSTHLTPMHL